MAEINITVNATATHLEKITDYLKYQTEIDGEANPQSRKAFLWEKTLAWYKEMYKAQKVSEANSALDTARTEAATETNTLTVGE